MNPPSELLPGFVPCSVERHYGAWLVEFDDGRSLLLQTDYDRAAFAVACGAIEAPDDWDGRPSGLGDAWAGFDEGYIWQCPDCYLDSVSGANNGALPVGSVVKFSDPKDETERGLEMVVIEDNGDRVKVEWKEPLEGGRFRPVAVYGRGELRAIESGVDA